MTPLSEAFRQSFESNADAHVAPTMRAYMRDQFPFLGIKTPERRKLSRAVLHTFGEPDSDTLRTTTTDLWALPEREYQYAALDILFNCAKDLTCDDVPTLERFILTKPWWDTVDVLAKVVGEVFRGDTSCRNLWLGKWRSSENLWLRRSAILFQLGYKAETDASLLFAIVSENVDSKEFFIQKASGWALREYTKIDTRSVEAFVKATPLAPLTRREALKHH